MNKNRREEYNISTKREGGETINASKTIVTKENFNENAQQKHSFFFSFELQLINKLCSHGIALCITENYHYY